MELERCSEGLRVFRSDSRRNLIGKGEQEMSKMITEYPLEPHKPLEDCSPEDVCIAYQHGFTAVIEDGELLGFYDTKEKTP